MMLRQRMIKTFILAFIAATIGAGIGLSTVQAETLSNKYVPGAGNVATAGTIGWVSGGEHGKGLSQSSTTLFYQYAGIRRWHLGAIDVQTHRSWTWSTGGSTNTLSTGVWSPGYATRSVFQRDIGWSPSEYYTSWPDYAVSCSTYWYTGNTC